MKRYLDKVNQTLEAASKEVNPALGEIVAQFELRPSEMFLQICTAPHWTTAQVTDLRTRLLAIPRPKLHSASLFLFVLIVEGGHAEPPELIPEK